MQAFEFHFNPKAKEDILFDSFVYEPENVYEKKLGNLCMVGELRNALPQNSKLLDRLASKIKKNYYQLSAQADIEKSFKQGLKQANELLKEEEKQENVSWLGNLNFALLSVKNSKLYFSKAGDIKILLGRAGRVIDISENVEQKEKEYPLEIFSNLASGSLTSEDKLLVATQEVWRLFAKKDLYSEVLEVFQRIQKPNKVYGELKKVFNRHKRNLSDVSGVFLLIGLGMEAPKLAISPRRFTFSPRLPKIPVVSAFTCFCKKLRGLLSEVVQKSKSFKKPGVSLPQSREKLKTAPSSVKDKLSGLFKFPQISLPKISFPPISTLKKFSILILALIVILGIGNYIFKYQRQKEIDKAQKILEEATQKAQQAENSLIFKDPQRANRLYQKAWETVRPLTKPQTPLTSEANSLKQSIETQLFKLNNLEKIDQPNLFFELRDKDFTAKHLTYYDSKLYFIGNNSESPLAYKLSLPSKTLNTLFLDQPVDLGIPTRDSLILLSRPQTLYQIKWGKTYTKKITLPYSDFKIRDWSRFGSNIYFLDSQNKEIVKYNIEPQSKKLKGKLWLDSPTQQLKDPKDIAIDGSIWILNQDNSIDRYFGGKYQETLTLNLFPYPENISQIYTSPNSFHIYLLEPQSNRLIIIDKTAQVVRQFQSNKFDDLKDFVVMESSNTIYLLSNSKVYQIQL